MKSVLLALLLLAPVSAFAQTTQTLTYDYDALPSEVATFTQMIEVNGASVIGNPTCVAKGTSQTACSIVIPPATVTAVKISASKNGHTATVVVPFSGVGPKPAMNPKINITVTVNVTTP